MENTKTEWKHSGANSIYEAVDRNTNGKASAFLNSGKKKYEIKNAQELADRLKGYADQQTHITIIGDYDTDGVCSTAEMYLLLTELGLKEKNITVRLPKRITEGFGLNENIIDEIQSGVVLTVDNGITAIPAIEKAKNNGLTVLVIDHHLPVVEDGTIRLPQADLIVDPNINMPEYSGTFNGYCASGLVYRIAQNLIPKTDTLKTISTLAMIGTMADVVDLDGDNRNIYNEGKKNMKATKARKRGYMTMGTAEIVKSYINNGDISEEDIAYQIAPKLNAPGRLCDTGAEKSLKLLLCRDEKAHGWKKIEEKETEASDLAKEINNINEKRKQEEDSAIIQAEKIIEKDKLYNENPIVIVDPKTPVGIVGLVSGKITEKYYRSSFVLTERNGVYKGSGRAVEGDNLKDALDQVYQKNPDIFVTYGGHEGAAGVTIKMEQLENFKNEISKAMEKKHTIPDSFYYDVEIKADDIYKTAEELDKFRPFGQGNPKIVFRINNFKLGSVTEFGKDENNKHIKFCCEGKEDIEAVWFGKSQEYKDMGEPKEMDLIGTISWTYEWSPEEKRGIRKHQIIVEDIIPG